MGSLLGITGFGSSWVSSAGSFAESPALESIEGLDVTLHSQHNSNALSLCNSCVVVVSSLSFRIFSSFSLAISFKRSNADSTRHCTHETSDASYPVPARSLAPSSESRHRERRNAFYYNRRSGQMRSHSTIPVNRYSDQDNVSRIPAVLLAQLAVVRVDIPVLKQQVGVAQSARKGAKCGRFYRIVVHSDGLHGHYEAARFLARIMCFQRSRGSDVEKQGVLIACLNSSVGRALA